MIPRANELFARPMPYTVEWKRDGRFVKVTTYSEKAALRVLDEETCRGNEPTLYLGGMVVESTQGAIA